MRLLSRTPIATADPVSTEDLADHLRIETVEAQDAMRYAAAAAREIEDHARLALLTQTIVAEADAAQVLTLPIGPVQEDETITVELVNPDGTLETISGWGLVAGWQTAVVLDETPERRVRVTYRAGYGSDPADIPADLRHAILDQALRLFDVRGDRDAPATLAPSAARISARYRRVSLGAA